MGTPVSAADQSALQHRRGFVNNEDAGPYSQQGPPGSYNQQQGPGNHTNEGYNTQGPGPYSNGGYNQQGPGPYSNGGYNQQGPGPYSNGGDNQQGPGTYRNEAYNQQGPATYPSGGYANQGPPPYEKGNSGVPQSYQAQANPPVSHGPYHGDGQGRVLGKGEYIDDDGVVRKRRGTVLAVALAACWCITWPCHAPCCCGL